MGDLDLWIFENQAAGRLLQNNARDKGHWLRIQLQGNHSNRDGIGALVEVRTAANVQRQRRTAETRYLTMQASNLTFGLGSATQVDVRVTWPSGQVDELTAVPVDQVLKIQEGDHLVAADPMPVRSMPTAYSHMALQELLDAREQETRSALHDRLLGQRLVAAEQWQDAVPFLRAAADEDRQDLTMAVHYARALVRTSDQEAVKSEVASWLQRFSLDMLVLNTLTYLGAMGESAIALQLLDAAIDQEPSSGSLHYLRGSIRFGLGQLDQALRDFEKARELDPEYFLNYLNLARIYMQKQQFELAEESALNALNFEPNSFLCIRILTRALLAQDRSEDAVAFYVDALENNSESYDLRLEFGNLMETLKRYRDAEIHYQTLVDEQPRKGKGWIALLGLYTILGNQPKAMQAARDAIIYNRENPQLLFQIAVTNEAFKQDARTVMQFLDQAVAKDPNFLKAWRMRARVSTRERFFEPAMESWSRILELVPNDDEATRTVEFLRGLRKPK